MTARPRTRRSQVIAACAACCIGATLLAACDSGGDDPKPSASAAPSEVYLTGYPSAQPSAEDGGQLRLVEQGFSQTPDAKGNGISYISLGLIIENTSATQGAVLPEVTVTLLDSQGRSVPTTETNSPTTTKLSPFGILPGERIGTGEVLTVEGATVATVNATVGEARWVVPNNTFARLAPVTASDLTIERAELQDTYTITYRVHSAYQRDIDRSNIRLVYRSGTGTIVGGSSSAQQKVPVYSVPPGDSTRAMTLKVSGGIPKDADLTKTEAYPM